MQMIIEGCYVVPCFPFHYYSWIVARTPDILLSLMPR